MNRETIFISHATPEDNEFTIWLGSRLELLGYTVWIDKDGLLGGEKFWENIDNVIRNKAIKFLLVYSQNILQKDKDGNRLHGKLKNGVYKEFSLAESIGSQNNLSDFIQLLNIDGSTYNIFIGADRLNQIRFTDNWAEGLSQLIKKLEKDNIPKLNNETSYQSWYSKYLQTENIQEKNELYYSNWWEIPDIPKQYYLYQFKTEKIAQKIYRGDNEFPIGKISNTISSFKKYEEFEVSEKDQIFKVKPIKIFEIEISDIFLKTEFIKYPDTLDRKNHFSVLLKRVFHLIMKKRGMFWYELSNKKIAYYFTPANLSSLKTKFNYPFRTKRKTKTKNLIGKHKSFGQWHYAISCKPILFPNFVFSLKSHLTFTVDGFKVWKDKDGKVDTKKLHSHRRAKGKRFFNEEWRDLLLAFLNALKVDDRIEIDLNEDFKLKMPSSTQLHWANFGYYDLKDKSRHDLLSYYEFEETNEEDELSNS